MPDNVQCKEGDRFELDHQMVLYLQGGVLCLTQDGVLLCGGETREEFLSSLYTWIHLGEELLSEDEYAPVVAAVGKFEGFEEIPEGMEQCPHCKAIVQADMPSQMAHMEQYHADIIAQRLAEVETLRGYVQD